MDCGPAALKSLLEGFYISASYGRLREACQTEVDGTSIDTIEQIAVQLGLDAEQIMLPSDHVLLPEADALPALVVVRQPNGMTHFIIIWRQHGRFVQVMDPGSGRRWVDAKRLLSELYIHRFPVPADAFRSWAGSNNFLDPLRRRMGDLLLSEERISGLIENASQDPTWRSLAALDATTRMVTSVVHARGLERGKHAELVLARFFDESRRDDGSESIPEQYWFVRQVPFDQDDPDAVETVTLRGAVLVHVSGTTAARRQQSQENAAAATQPTDEPDESSDAGEAHDPLEADHAPTQSAEPESDQHAARLPPELVAALQEPPLNPEREVWNVLRQDGVLIVALVSIASCLAAVGTMIEAFLLQAVMRMGTQATKLETRTFIIAALSTFVVLLFAFEVPLMVLRQRMGRRLEARLRILLLEKIPRLSDRYFHSRLTSDMTMRAHSLRSLRELPSIALSAVRLTLQLILTAAGVVILAPDSAPFAILFTLAFLGFSVASNLFMREREMRMNTHTGALSRFYLDALLGLVPARMHGAERSLRREHESLLTGWARTSLETADVSIFIQGISAVLYGVFSVGTIWNFVEIGGPSANTLLLFYWTLNLPSLAQSLYATVERYPQLRNHVLRLLEPLGAPDDVRTVDATESTSSSHETPIEHDPQLLLTAPKGCSIRMNGVCVQAGGNSVLNDIELEIDPGEHIAVVGPSGAGKSSLVGLLLGWHQPTAGECIVDGLPLDGPRLRVLRRETAWVDPAVQLWNRSLLDNLQYGDKKDDAAVGRVLRGADLYDVLERLPEGMQTTLGESGGLVSGGEGQRVRVGRAMHRKDVRLAILDEPFRGLDRDTRSKLLKRARDHWRDATILCVTHDVGETLGFERVLVVDEGRIVEDGRPEDLAADPDSRYRTMLDAEVDVRRGLWANAGWRRLWLENGQLTQLSQQAPDP